MQKSKGFTLVEMLAVIAVLGIIVLLVVPNVLKNYKDAKKLSFIDEAKTVYTKATDKYVLSRTQGKKLAVISNAQNQLDLNNAEDLEYTVRMDKTGSVVSFRVTNGEYCIVGVGDFLNNYSISDIIVLDTEEDIERCDIGDLSEGAIYTLQLRSKGTVKRNYNYNDIYLKYGIGWFSNKDATKKIESVEVPYRENTYFEGAWATNTLGSDIQTIACNGDLVQDEYGGGIFTGKEENPYVTSLSKFTKKYYIVKYVGGDDSTGSMEELKCEYNSDCYLPTNKDANGYGLNIKKPGFIFLGWKQGSKNYEDGAKLPKLTDSNEDDYPAYKFDNTKVCSGEQVPTTPITFEAQWDAIEYDVAYSCNTGNGTMANTHHVYGTAKNLRKNTCTKQGYTFLGWALSSEATTKKYSDEESVSNLTEVKNDTVTLYAVWQANTYSITYSLNNGSLETKPSSGKFDSDVTINNPTRDYYKFVGWKITGMDNVLHTYGTDTTTATSIDSTKATTFRNLRSSAGNVNFEALWTGNVYTITLDNKDATTKGTEKIYEKYESDWYSNSDATTSITTITKPVRNNYTFTGYFDGSTRIIDKDGKILAANNKYTANKTLNVKWCNSCANVQNGDCTINIANDGTCTYETTCRSGYNLTAGDGTYNPTCTPIASLAGHYTGKFKFCDKTCGSVQTNADFSTMNTHWKLYLYSDGKLTITSVSSNVDIFVVGGGGGGGLYSASLPVWANNCQPGGGGGGGGRTGTLSNHALATGEYNIDIGDGGPRATSSGSGTDGAPTYFDNLAGAAGGSGGGMHKGGAGGSGGGGGTFTSGGVDTYADVNSKGGQNGNNGQAGYANDCGSRGGAGSGQGYTTKEFGESGGTIYADGGGGAGHFFSKYSYDGVNDGAHYFGGYANCRGNGGGCNGHINGTANTGGGGSGGFNGNGAGNGGSGIAIMRNHGYQ